MQQSNSVSSRIVNRVSLTNFNAANWIVLGGVIAAALIGAATITAPVVVAGLISVTSACAILLWANATLRKVGLFFLVLVVFGYSMQGRAFAYWGYSPVYIGDFVLLATAAIVFARGRWVRISSIGWLIISFMSLGILRTLPFIGMYHLDAIRDAAIWYYAAFALIVINLMSFAGLERTLGIFARVMPYAAVWYFAMSTVLIELFQRLPSLPTSPLPVLSAVTSGHRGVVLAAMATFMFTNLQSHFRGRRRIEQAVFWLFWTGSTVILATISRGGFLAVIAAFAVVVVLLPSARWLKYCYIVILLIFGLWLVNPSIDLSSSRDLSVSQLIANTTSIVVDSGSNVGSVSATREWRLQWWNHILQGTVFGPRFWDGWGFGINLATEYGQVYVADEFGLRSPHNSHITILARMGVPGLLVWLSLQATFAWQIFRAARRQRSASDSWRGRVFVWILAVWAAMMTESMFDVYLESPHGAILYWCLIGFGMVALGWDRTTVQEPNPLDATQLPHIGTRQ